MAEAGLIPVPTTAVILAGGRGSRLGGREKGEIRLDGHRLLDIVIEGACSAGCDPVIVAGDLTSEKATSVREEPPFGGPVAGLAAALRKVKTEWFMLLACDLPHAHRLCHLLAESFHQMTPELDGLVALHENRIQWLAGVYRRESVERSLTGLDGVDGASLGALLGRLTLREVQDPEGLSRDIDTPEDLVAAKRKEEE